MASFVPFLDDTKINKSKLLPLPYDKSKDKNTKSLKVEEDLEDGTFDTDSKGLFKIEISFVIVPLIIYIGSAHLNST